MSSPLAISSMQDAPEISSIPYYLTPNEDLKEIEPGVINLFNYDLPSNQYVEPTQSVWSEIGGGLSETVNTAGDYVWSAADGVWKSAKEIVSGAGDLVGEGYSFLKTEIIMWLGVALLIIWVISKSGILKQLPL